jgi:hypothetical protein
MMAWDLVREYLTALLEAAAQVFRWLNTRQDRDDKDERDQRVGDVQEAAARPNRKNADRLNRWLQRGRSGRLRNRRSG